MATKQITIEEDVYNLLAERAKGEDRTLSKQATRDLREFYASGLKAAVDNQPF